MLPAIAQAQDTEKLAPYYPTPETIVARMLQFGELKAGEKMFDLGSGDGRIVIMAARKFKADSTGVEFDKDLCRQSSERIKKLGLGRRARIVNGDIMKQDYSFGQPAHRLPAARLQRQATSAAREAAQEGNSRRLARF